MKFAGTILRQLNPMDYASLLKPFDARDYIELEETFVPLARQVIEDNSSVGLMPRPKRVLVTPPPGTPDPYGIYLARPPRRY